MAGSPRASRPPRRRRGAQRTTNLLGDGVRLYPDLLGPAAPREVIDSRDGLGTGFLDDGVRLHLDLLGPPARRSASSMRRSAACPPPPPEMPPPAVRPCSPSRRPPWMGMGAALWPADGEEGGRRGGATLLLQTGSLTGLGWDHAGRDPRAEFTGGFGHGGRRWMRGDEGQANAGGGYTEGSAIPVGKTA